MKFGLALLAVLLGNIMYFLLLAHLPEALRHRPTRLDLGLALDFLLCLALWLGLTAATRRRGAGAESLPRPPSEKPKTGNRKRFLG